MAKLIREDGRGHRQVRRPDGRTEQFARAPRWRIRYGLFYPDGSRVIRSKMTGRRTDGAFERYLLASTKSSCQRCLKSDPPPMIEN